MADEVIELDEESSEWETQNERVVEWSEEQTAYLRKRLAEVSVAANSRLIKDLR